MQKKGAIHALLGLDIGRIKTQAAYFGIEQEKFKLQAFGSADSSLGADLQLGSGAGAAMLNLQEQSEVHLLKPNGELIWPTYDIGLGVDRIAVTISGGPELRTVLLGLTQEGSLKEGRTLVESFPLSLIGIFDLTALSDESKIVDTLVALHPDVVILSGGVNGGAEYPLSRWIEVLTLVCRILPKLARPDVVYVGNALMETPLKRHLEPLTAIKAVPNIRPYHQEVDLVPAQAALDKVVIKKWQRQIPGFQELITRTKALVGSKGFMLGRMARYLSHASRKMHKGVMAIDLGHDSTTVAAGLWAESGILYQSAGDSLLDSISDDMVVEVRRWTAQPVSSEEVRNFLYNHALKPAFIPDDPQSMAICQALARYRIHQASARMGDNYAWYPYEAVKGLAGRFEPVVVGGAIFNQAPSAGHRLLMILDGLQPLGVTTIVHDRYQIMPLLGLVGEGEPLIPTHVLSSNAFISLGTVITAVAEIPAEEHILTVEVRMDNGKDFDVEILQGRLTRLLIPPEVTAELTLKPLGETDIGFGGCGVGGRLKVPGGSMGVVIDARGRPLKLPDEDEKRLEVLNHWLMILGG